MASFSPFTSQPLVGVLGGMGPRATVDFLQKIILHSSAQCDQDHVPLMVASVPQIPDRGAALEGLGPSPLEALISNGLRLVNAGAELIVMPCNTAHAWYGELQQALGKPMLHIADAALQDVAIFCRPHARVGLLGTAGTLHASIYQSRALIQWVDHEVEWLLPTAFEIESWIAPAIAAVKAGRLEQAQNPLLRAANELALRGASCIVMGCTEIPLAMDATRVAVPLVDAGDALARMTVKWQRGQARISRNAASSAMEPADREHRSSGAAPSMGRS